MSRVLINKLTSNSYTHTHLEPTATTGGDSILWVVKADTIIAAPLPFAMYGISTARQIVLGSQHLTTSNINVFQCLVHFS
mmetsp:Transcript_47932/g.78951  ORF Transcript_47932/g.78951 Transcript_47932/m.78951 type:complete len:80 (+) Transcript_47932:92-331(+)